MMNQVTKLEAQDVLNYYNLVHIWTVTFNFQEISIIFNVFFQTNNTILVVLYQKTNWNDESSYEIGS